MANAFLTVQEIAEEALATLYESTPMHGLVHTDLTSEFGTKAKGNTIDIRVPAVFQAKRFNRANGIELQDATEGSIPVVLDAISDVSVPVTDEDMTLNIKDFTAQLLNPMIEALAQDIDISILALRSGVSQVAGFGTEATTNGETWDKPEVLIEAGRLLDLNSVPMQDRYAVVGPTTKARWLNSDIIKHAEKSGDTAALRAGSIGKSLFGFDAFQTGNVGQPAATPASGAPTTEVGLAFHKTALAFGSAPLQLPAGANIGQVSVVSYKGLSIRISYGWDIKYKQTVISADMLFGVKLLDAKRAVLLKGANQV
ncbi:P22 phage major capsid protein family protein [Cryobacterium sp. PH31-O1]|uniref:P22 phage major capsid protein family protein n=1 Tax=Cryobacterium sp. PH31-O1 TaxID=3046306 RepID=UPI0024BB95CC|nr:P22 phage major capsid protein family protein [Cryobacterium sp. PH31-O1]MDJ0337461.1 P22 phage major capsid protein family protein [Cryobacterium sp. PH31-O1]